MSHLEGRPRLNLVEQAPDLIGKLKDFGMTVAASGHIERRMGQPVDIRASQMNGCAACLDMHVKQARLNGERELRLHHIAIWRESPLFSAKERAALTWTEALTQIAPTGISDDLYAELRERFSEQELSVLTFRVIGINAANRANVAFRTPPGKYDRELGLDKAELA